MATLERHKVFTPGVAGEGVINSTERLLMRRNSDNRREHQLWQPVSITRGFLL